VEQHRTDRYQHHPDATHQCYDDPLKRSHFDPLLPARWSIFVRYAQDTAKAGLRIIPHKRGGVKGVV